MIKNKKQKKNKILEFKVEPYSSIVKIVLTHDIKQAAIEEGRASGVPDEELESLEDDLVEAGAYTFWNYPNFVLFFNIDELKIHYITHEVFHVTHGILECAHSKFDYHNHEHFAYLNGFLNKMVFEFVQNCKYKATI